MSTSPGSSHSLSGRLLLAAPSLRDPNFSRSVILMVAHNQDDGAFGYVLNRPLKQKVADLLPDQSLGSLGEVPVYVGGPVSTDKLAFAALNWNQRKRSLRCQTHLSVPDALEALGKGLDVRGFVGYSGWTGGQLEEELERRSWITSQACSTVLTTEKPTLMWSEVLEEMGPVYRLMSRMPERVDLN